MITSLENPRIKAARKLQTKQYRLKSGKLLIEGVRLMLDALESGFPPEQVYYSPEVTATRHDARKLLDQLVQAGVNCFPVSTQVLVSLAETVTPQGVVAVVAMPDVPVPASPSLVLVLDGVADPGNAGTLLRSAEAAGADLVVFGPGSVDAFNGKVVRAGMGAHFRLPLHPCTDWEEVRSAVSSVANVYVAEAGADLAYDAVNWCEPSALIVGSEASGPTESARSLATAVSIPMLGSVESLNAGMAGTILLFEAARQRRNYVQSQR